MTLSVPVEQWVGNSFKVHKRVLALNVKNLHLAVASWVIDDKQVHRILCKDIQTALNEHGLGNDDPNQGNETQVAI